MAAKLDVSASSVVVYCKECSWFSCIATDEASGHDLAVAHEGSFHPLSKTALMNRLYFARRFPETAH